MAPVEPLRLPSSAPVVKAVEPVGDISDPNYRKREIGKSGLLQYAGRLYEEWMREHGFLDVELGTVGDVVQAKAMALVTATRRDVVSDVIAIGRNLLKGAVGRVPVASFQQDQRRPLRMKPMEEISSLYYLRFMVVDRPGVLAQIAGELGRCGISISSMLQQGRREGQTVPVVIKTHMAKERDVQSALREINRKAVVSEPATLIRVEGKDE